jgi:hypothetical protein
MKYTGAREYDFTAHGYECHDRPDRVHGDEARVGHAVVRRRRAVHLGFGRIIISEVEVPNILVNMV